jgi:CheY-like chemotaxis protein
MSATVPQNWLRTHSILLVEDDLDLAVLYAHALEHHAINVTRATNGDQALRLARSLEHDLILMDIGLPDRSGIEVMAQLRADPVTANLPMLVLSNYSDPDLAVAAEALGVLGYLVKFETPPLTLAATVDRLLA